MRLANIATSASRDAGQSQEAIVIDGLRSADPTTLLRSFLRSSERMHRWLLHRPRLGGFVHHIRDLMSF